jgi:FixJ family two-component response regulator
MFQQPTGADVTVYVVDDDQQSSRAIAELVRTFGHQVKEFDGPQAFLDDLDQGSPDQFGVVILDHRMPGMDGLEVSW